MCLDKGKISHWSLMILNAIVRKLVYNTCELKSLLQFLYILNITMFKCGFKIE